MKTLVNKVCNIARRLLRRNIMAEIRQEDTGLLVHIKYSKPIEIEDFTSMMNALNSLYSSYVKQNAQYSQQTKAKLYVNQIKEGSIEVFFCDFLCNGGLIPFAENANLLWDFGKNIISFISYLTKRKGKEPSFTLSDLKNMKEVFSTTSKDENGETGISIVNIKNPKVVYKDCIFNYNEGNSAQNQIERKINEIQSEEMSDVYQRVLMEIYQIRNEIDKATGNKAIIDEVFSGKKLPVLFASDDIKERILFSDDNPTQKLFYVDVRVKYIECKPKAYEVLALHEVIDK